MPRLIRKVAEGSREKVRTANVESGVDVIGDIAIVRLTRLESEEKRDFARALLLELPGVKCVFDQEGGIEGEYRLRKLRFLAGEDRTVTTHNENGCRFRVDVAKAYFSPRLSTERLRIAESASPGERVLNMFAGVGPFSIPIAKRKKARVTSCELNSSACEFHNENNRLNKVEGLVDVVNADAHELPGLLKGKFDLILMPHPTKANEFLVDALALAARKGRVHYYRQVLGRDEEEADKELRSELEGLLPPGTAYNTRRVRAVGPRWLEMAADIQLGA